MSSRLRKALFERGDHNVGEVNSSWAKPFTNGAKILADADNYILVEKAGYDADGNLQVQALTDSTKEGFLLATVEEEHLMTEYGETYVDFYNAQGEMVNVIYVEKGLRFEASNFTKNTGVTTIALGYVAHYDVATKTYIVSNPSSAHANYAGAFNKFEIVGVDTDFGYNAGKTTIRLQAK